MIFETIVVGPLEVNCYVLGCEKTKEVFVVDPGDDPEKIMYFLSASGLTPLAMINTHGHIDHAGAVRFLQDELSIPCYIHPDDQPLFQGLKTQSEMFGLYFSGIPTAPLELHDRQILQAGSVRIRVLHTPGHSRGGVCLLSGDVLISGDTLFSGSIGRTDLIGGNFEQLIQSIREKLLVLPDETRVYPGHGPKTTIGRERRYNSFLR